MVSLIDVTQRLGGGLPDRTTSRKVRRAPKPYTRTGLVALRSRAASGAKKEVGSTIKKFKGTAWDQSPLFKKLY